jgi:hypothetical protein
MNIHVIKSLLIVAGIVVTIVIGKILFTPESWGKYGHYRADYIDEEASKPLVYGQNESCKRCHEEVNELKDEGKHKRLSCEMCHSPLSEHIAGDKKIGDMYVAKGDELDALCLRCHQEGVIGRPESFPTVDKKEHLKERKVRPDHHCNQCHTVHHPLENIEEARRVSHHDLAEVIKDEE